MTSIDPARVLLNLLWLRPGQVGGTENYAVRLLGSLADSGRLPRLVVSPALAAAHGPLVSRFPHEVARPRGGRVGRVVAERLRFAGEREAVVHHLGGTVAASGGSPVVVTIYDLQVLDHPQFFHPLKRRYLERALPTAVERADRVCVMSEWVASGLQRHLGVGRDRCVVVPPIVESVVEAKRYPGDQQDRFLLYPAMTWPHKRHTLLVELMERVADLDLRLVLTGAAGPVHAEVLSAIESSPARERITHLGRVDSSALEDLYRSAHALVFPSVYEGFGQPLIEAMARGCPVVASAATAVPETVGQAGLLVEDDVEAWEGALRGLDDVRRTELIELGYRRAEVFTPDAAAHAQWAVYEDVAPDPA